MNPQIEPTDEIIMGFVFGTLDPGLSLLVSLHLERSAQTRQRLRAFERLGGDILLREDGVPLTAGSLDRALARISRASFASSPKRSEHPALPEPSTLSWRWAGPGSRLAPVHVEGSALKLFLMETDPGRAMLAHGHSAREWTVILEGSYRDEHGQFSAGAFIEETEEDHHRPIVDSTVPCLSLITLEGQIVARGLSGLVARWLLR